MTPTPFIFSNERKYRLQRHIAFWVAWWLFMAVLYAYFVPVPEDYNGYLNYQLPVSLVNALLYMPAHIFLTYSLIYFIIPRHLVKGKYILSAVLVIIAFILTAAFSNIIYSGLVSRVDHFLFPKMKDMYVAHRGNMYITLLAGLRGGITVGGIGAAIKLMKYFYFKEQRNLQLQKENMESQLQVLKAQIHPHFLFNTMNNIYSYTQNTSPEASRMIMGLSDILRYMLYDCNQPLVSLAKELKMLEEFIDLEKVRYGNSLELHIDLPQNTQIFFIAPLLMIPFVENCFKHGTSDILDQPWMNLNISMNDNEMKMIVMNGKPPGVSRQSDLDGGIGISNVRKRLELLYPGKHELIIKEEEEVFIVNLKLSLEKRKDKIPAVARLAETINA
jgi:sensor histidine kinase YesM